MPRLLPPLGAHVVAAASVLLGAVLARDPPDSTALVRRPGEALWWEACGCETAEVELVCRALCSLLRSQAGSRSS